MQTVGTPKIDPHLHKNVNRRQLKIPPQSPLFLPYVCVCISVQWEIIKRHCRGDFLSVGYFFFVWARKWEHEEAEVYLTNVIQHSFPCLSIDLTQCFFCARVRFSGGLLLKYGMYQTIIQYRNIPAVLILILIPVSTLSETNTIQKWCWDQS